MAKRNTPPQTKRLEVKFNPFEPSGSSAPLVGDEFWLPSVTWKERLQEHIGKLGTGEGARSLVVVGGYGSGKSYVLRWLERVEFPRLKVLPYYFENPEVRFYDLANSLLRRIGRKHFAKLLWELAEPNRENPQQRTLFSKGFEAYLDSATRKVAPAELHDLQEAIKKSAITEDEEIAHRFALLIAETARKPFFEYR